MWEANKAAPEPPASVLGDTARMKPGLRASQSWKAVDHRDQTPAYYLGRAAISHPKGCLKWGLPTPCPSLSFHQSSQMTLCNLCAGPVTTELASHWANSSVLMTGVVRRQWRRWHLINTCHFAIPHQPSQGCFRPPLGPECAAGDRSFSNSLLTEQDSLAKAGHAWHSSIMIDNSKIWNQECPRGQQFPTLLSKGHVQSASWARLCIWTESPDCL